MSRRSGKRRSGDGWNPYLAGALAGLLAVASAWATTAGLGRTSYLGASTSFVRAAAFLLRRAAPERLADNVYFQGTGAVVDWQFMLVGGILLGALAAAFGDRSFRLEAAPPIWRERFGTSASKRLSFGFLGGLIAMFGARLADGCPSGHGLSGMMQLSASAWLALPVFFAAGALVAARVYRRRTP